MPLPSPGSSNGCRPGCCSPNPTGPPAAAGRRDATLLATLYDTAARVQELADLTVRDIRLQHPAMAALTGKGRKTRHVPLMGNTTAILTAYLTEHRLDTPGHDDHPVFFNQHRSKLSRGGIAWIISKYLARTDNPQLTDADISPHTLRHSKAMHLYEAGVPLPYIRDILDQIVAKLLLYLLARLRIATKPSSPNWRSEFKADDARDAGSAIRQNR